MTRMGHARSRWSLTRRPSWALVLAPMLAVAGLAVATASPAAARSQGPHSGSARQQHVTVAPKPVNNVAPGARTMQSRLGPLLGAPAKGDLPAARAAQITVSGSIRYTASD